MAADNNGGVRATKKNKKKRRSGWSTSGELRGRSLTWHTPARATLAVLMCVAANYGGSAANDGGIASVYEGRAGVTLLPRTAVAFSNGR
eukprot:2100221-Rhodomonas_salina.3